MQLSKLAWKKSEKIIAAIKNHSFNQELMRGTLAQDKFMYYIEQDILYLNDYAKCFSLLAAKVPSQYTDIFLQYAKNTNLNEQQVVHHFFEKTFQFEKNNTLTLATLSYTSYLLKTCALDPFEVGIAALLPCLWVYHEVALAMQPFSPTNNLYARWIETYVSIEFAETTYKVIDIFNTIAKDASKSIKEKMLTAFYNSVCLEWHFWEDAYNKTIFDDFIIKV